MFSGLVLISFLNHIPKIITDVIKIIAIAGVKFIIKSINDNPALLPIMMFGGSPINVAVPPILEAKTSLIFGTFPEFAKLSNLLISLYPV